MIYGKFLPLPSHSYYSCKEDDLLQKIRKQVTREDIGQINFITEP